MMQGVAGSESSSMVPAVHAVHAVAPASAYLPAEHTAHGVAASASVSARPTVHGVQLVALELPVLPTYFPVGHGMQFNGSGPAPDEVVEYRPAGHGPEHRLVVLPPLPY